MTTVALIERKRDGGRLTDEQIEWLIGAYTRGEVADYQMAAMAMAVFLNGLDADELAAWTRAMLRSGEVLDFSHLAAPKVDKHSTGGVGDKVSIPLAPMVAACGVVVPMMSGRGLGHTGGTLDKLESIPGFTTSLDPERFTEILERTGLVLAGQSDTLVPADRRLYALRDATGTVPSIPLIASSIMSKKLAEGLDGLVLDVKVGRGAFMTNEERARELAETMVGIGRDHGVQVVAYLTDMDQPLGKEVGNACEIRESIDVLRGQGPPDLVELVLALGAEMLIIGRGADDSAEARRRLEEAVASGKALEKLVEVVRAQGGDPQAVADPIRLPTAAHTEEICAHRTGYVTRCDALLVGEAAMRLGAGRERKEDDIDPAVGVTVLAKRGDQVEQGQPLATVAWNDNARRREAVGRLEGAWEIGDTPQPSPPLVLGRVEG
ncbi:MAG: thymidine phosphorylase [Acidimicrobiia bacterium]